MGGRMTNHGLDGIIAAAQMGEEWAWERLYDDLSPRLMGYFKVRGATSAEDLVGEAFVQLARNLPTFTGDATSFRSWVFMIAHNRLSNQRRSLARKPEVLVADLDRDTRCVPSAESDALAEITGSEALGKLASLTPDQRDVVALRFIADLSVRETAEILGASAGSVKQLTRRALIRLRQEILEETVTQ